MQEARRAHYSRQQSLVVDRLVDNLALEAASSYGGTRKPAVAQALKKQLHKAAQKLPSLAAASPEPLVSEPEVVVVRTAVMEADGGAADGVVMKEAVVSTVVMEADGGAADRVVMKQAVAVAVVAAADPEVLEPLLAPIEVGCASDIDLQSYDTFSVFCKLITLFVAYNVKASNSGKSACTHMHVPVVMFAMQAWTCFVIDCIRFCHVYCDVTHPVNMGCVADEAHAKAFMHITYMSDLQSSHHS